MVPSTGDQPERVRYTLPRHKRGDWVGPGCARKSAPPGASGVVELSPFEVLDRLAPIIPPRRKHRHRYHWLVAPNHPLRPAVTAMAIGNLTKPHQAVAGEHGGTSTAAAGDGCGAPGSIAEQPCHHDTSGIAWAKLLARVGEEFPLACPSCGGDVRLISFITQLETIRKILTHVGEPLEPPHVSPARGPPVDWGDLERASGDEGLERLAADDLPMIDIHDR